MDYFTRRNVAILALLQIGVIAFGVLAAAVTLKWHATFRIFNADAARRWADYGWFAMLLPIAWAALAAYILEGEAWSDRAKVVAFLSGILLLVALACAVWSAIGRQWFGLPGG